MLVDEVMLAGTVLPLKGLSESSIGEVQEGLLQT
jgi:hypothetical protein